MIIFCEECGVKNCLVPEKINGNEHNFNCCGCGESLSVAAGGAAMKTSMHAVANFNACKIDESKGPAKILIVDDSSFIRRVLKDMFSTAEGMEIVGEAENGQMALDLISELKPDVVTLDVNMPVMDGLTAIKHIMIKHPTPVVMFSTLTGEGTSETFDALRFGAVDFMQKPSSLLNTDLKKQQDEIAKRVRAASLVRTETIRYLRAAVVEAPQQEVTHKECNRFFAIGTSEGGYASLLGIIPELKYDIPGAFFTVLDTDSRHVDAFTHYLDSNSPIKVKRARQGDTVNPGCCYIGSRAESISLNSEKDGVRLNVGKRDSDEGAGRADSLMSSLSDATADKAVGLILSGATEDGVAGAGKILAAGGAVFVQDPDTCLCSGTADLTVETHNVNHVLSSRKMAETINDFCS